MIARCAFKMFFCIVNFCEFAGTFVTHTHTHTRVRILISFKDRKLMGLKVEVASLTRRKLKESRKLPTLWGGDSSVVRAPDS